MNNSLIPQIGSPSDVRLYSLSEAELLLPQVQKLTRHAVVNFEPIQFKYQRHLDCDPRKEQLALDYENIVCSWATHMKRLGLVVRGLWEVDFHTGDGYLSRCYPELRLAFFVALDDQQQNADVCQKCWLNSCQAGLINRPKKVGLTHLNSIGRWS